ncbi:MAG: 3-deoxy-manno-octulosonate cytidylyltransferase [Pseudomonadota bacterium]
MRNPVIIIPARMASLRLPGKPLADICGLPMIVRVCARAALAGLGPVVVAAAEREIAHAVEKAGYPVVMTDPDLPSGSDRVHAACKEIDPDGDHDVVINLQGDMPTLDPSSLIQLGAALSAFPEADIATLAAPITEDAERDDPNVVKAVLSGHGREGAARALYFSRATVPTGPGPVWHHVGVYAFRRDALDRFVAAPQSPLEGRERLEQLRALEIGMTIACAVLKGEPPNGVDTPEDLAAARAWYKERGMGR